MKKIENNFAVTGFVGKDAEIRQFANSQCSPFFFDSKPTGEGTARNPTAFPPL